MRKAKFDKTRIICNESVEGKSIEKELEKIMTQGVGIDNSAPLTYTERKDGVLPQYNIRTDRFEIAQNAMDKVSGTYKAMREERIKIAEEEKSKISQSE